MKCRLQQWFLRLNWSLLTKKKKGLINFKYLKMSLLFLRSFLTIYYLTAFLVSKASSSHWNKSRFRSHFEFSRREGSSLNWCRHWWSECHQTPPRKSRWRGLTPSPRRSTHPRKRTVRWSFGFLLTRSDKRGPFSYLKHQNNFSLWI